MRPPQQQCDLTPPAERSDSALEPPLLSADNNQKASADPAAAPATPPQTDQVTNRPEPEQSAGDAIPEPRRTQADPDDVGRQPRTLPYDDPTYVAMHLEVKMESADFLESTRLMAAKCWDRAGVESSMDLLREMLETAAQRDPDSLRALLEQFTTEASTP